VCVCVCVCVCKRERERERGRIMNCTTGGALINNSCILFPIRVLR